MASVPDYAPPPPAPPAEEREGGSPRWPVWGPFVAIALGLAVSITIVSVIAAVIRSAGGEVRDDDPWFTVFTTLAVDLCVVGATLAVARATARPAPWQFGLRRAPLGFAVGMAFIAAISVVVFSAVYSSVVDTENKQRIVQDLGANTSTTLLVIGAVVVIVIAPLCEELFFRGFLFRVLRQRMGFWLAAGVDGVLFGLVHGSIAILPILAVLAIALCWVYERTGSIFPCIALHVLNNTLAYGDSTHDGWAAAGAAGALVLAACVLVPAALPRGAPAPA